MTKAMTRHDARWRDRLLGLQHQLTHAVETSRGVVDESVRAYLDVAAVAVHKARAALEREP